MAEVKELKAVVKRLAGNAGLDFSNPQRGVNAGATPSVKNPVGQKLSSLADVSTYNVLDEQVLSWSQLGQKWLPVTLPTPTAGGTIDISEVSYSGLAEGYGVVTSPTEYVYTAASVVPNEFGPDYYYTESWTTGTAYIGAGNWDDGPAYALIEMDVDGFGRPSVQLTADDYVDGTFATTTLSSFSYRIEEAYFVLHRCATAARPTGLGTDDQERGACVYDTDLSIPIFWNGTAWTDALGTTV
jgi:hypothetical protein